MKTKMQNNWLEVDFGDGALKFVFNGMSDATMAQSLARIAYKYGQRDGVKEGREAIQGALK